MNRREAMDVLGLRDAITPEALKLAYRRKAMEAHPDRGGTNAAMSRVNEAQEVLEKALKVPASRDVWSIDLEGDWRQRMRDAMNGGRAQRAYDSERRRQAKAPPREERTYARAEARQERRGRGNTVLPDEPEEIAKRRRDSAQTLFKFGLIDATELKELLKKNSRK